MLIACGETGPPELEQTAGTVEDMLKPVNLSGSTFSAAFADGKPSPWVSFLFSEVGTAEWPPSKAWADD